MGSTAPEQLTDPVFVFGNDDFRHYRVGSHGDVLVECGVTASARYFAVQLHDTGRPAPDKLSVRRRIEDH